MPAILHALQPFDSTSNGAHAMYPVIETDSNAAILCAAAHHVTFKQQHTLRGAV
jgi:hypothetical protein